MRRPARQQASFKDMLLDGIQQVNSMQQQADVAVQQLMTGDDVDPAVVLTTIQKADMSFRMMMQIRNKLVRPTRKSRRCESDALARDRRCEPGTTRVSHTDRTGQDNPNTPLRKHGSDGASGWTF